MTTKKDVSSIIDDNEKLMKDFYGRHKTRDPKSSKGYNKFIEYVEELRRNVYFKKDFEEFCKFLNKSKRINKQREIDKKILNLCKKYNIPIGTLEGLGYIEDGNRFEMGWAGGYEINYDMNYLLDLYPFFYEKSSIPINDLLTKNKEVIIEALINCFPVAISLHKFSTKRDLLDYIEKNWNTIEKMLSRYREKPYRGRNKKNDWELVDFIWENHNSNSKEIKEKLKNKFPHHGLIYSDILKIISLEKKRRNKNITQDKKYPRKDLKYNGNNCWTEPSGLIIKINKAIN